MVCDNAVTEAAKITFLLLQTTDTGVSDNVVNM
jgi:hypothetical protein